jgi:alpha-N-arabinofuranosidase
MPRKATITVHPAFRIGEISSRLYGAFLEPIGTMVNGTMFSPGHPTADDKGFRRDFISALRETPLPVIRLPGGNFVSGWDWKDSIGPKELRKAHLDLAWHQYIPNDVGLDEYLQWSERVGTEPLYTINLGTGDLNDAIYIAEYVNHEGGTYWSDLRRKNGHEAPYGVKLWYLGNEMDGPWQIGSWERDPRGYGIRANEVSKAMKWVDGSIETAVCGSSSPFLAHFPQWDLEVLQECYESVDYVSLHHYHSAPAGDFGALLGGSVFYEEYINTEIALCDFVQAKCRSPRKMLLSFDEYGTMARPNKPLHPGYGPHNLYREHYAFSPDRKMIRHDPDNMTTADLPPMHGQGDMVDALANAAVLLAFLRHADRVKVGCMTGGLMALAASDREHIWRRGSYYPFTQLMTYGQGVSMQTTVDCETFDLPGYAVDDNSQYSSREGLPFLDTAAALDEEKGELNLFVIHRGWESEQTVCVDVSGFEGWSLTEHIQMYSDDLNAANTFENPNAVVPTVNKSAVFENGKVSACLKSLSWNIFRFHKTNASRTESG